MDSEHRGEAHGATLCRRPSRYDYLEVGSGLDPMDPYSKYVTLFGRGPEASLMLEAESVWLRFYSDVSIGGDGFTLTLDQPATSGKVHLSSMAV